MLKEVGKRADMNPVINDNDSSRLFRSDEDDDEDGDDHEVVDDDDDDDVNDERGKSDEKVKEGKFVFC